MTFLVADRVKETTTTAGGGTLTLAGAVAGFQAFSVIGNANTTHYTLLDANGTGWEVGIGTYTLSGTTLARTTILASSAAGAAITLSAGTHTVFCGMPALGGLGAINAAQAVTPGGRLTLTTAVPVTTADVTGATTIYYTPYLHNIINLWNGSMWTPVVFAEVSLALGTLTTLRPHDVFGFLNAGALNTELLAWTSDTARATAITLQDGRYCKSGDKTRLYLGSFRTTSTTQTEDSGGDATTNVGGKRFVFNMYNRVARFLGVKDTADWSYSTATIRQANGNAGNKVEFLLGVAEDQVSADLLCNIYMYNSGSAPGIIGIGLDSMTTFAGHWGDYYVISTLSSGAVQFGGPASYHGLPALGYHYLSWNEKGGTNTGFYGDDGGLIQSGLYATVMA